VIRELVAATAAVSLCACAPRYLQSELSPDATLYEFSRVMVLPVAATETDRLSAARQSDRQGQAGAAESYRTGEVAAGADAVVTDLLYGALAEQPSLELVARALVEREMAALSQPPSPPALQALARKLRADVILRGLVTDYREREGSHVGVAQPAAVGIQLWLVAARDGQMIWQGRYYEVQQSMTEDPRTLPLYLKRGTRWLTASELAKYAVGELVKTLPPPRAASSATTP